jgi:hypothetical protein
MNKSKIVSITYHADTPKESIVFISQIITNIIIRELRLSPKESGGLVKCSHELLVPFYTAASERNEFYGIEDQ